MKKPSWLDHALACMACALTTAVTLPLHGQLAPVNLVMLYLLTVVIVAARLGRGPSVLASVLSVGLFDFFHVPPRWSFAIQDFQYLLTLAVMLTVALIISHLTIGLRRRAQEAQQAAERSHALYALASSLAGALAIEQVCEATRRFAHDQLQADVRLLVPGPPTSLQAALPDQAPLETSLALVAQAVYSNHKGGGTQQLGDDGQLHAVLPLSGSTRARGV
ncbi:MAG: DUF4118 domain-containing protein [Aquabacterium sp.]